MRSQAVLGCITAGGKVLACGSGASAGDCAAFRGRSSSAASSASGPGWRRSRWRADSAVLTARGRRRRLRRRSSPSRCRRSARRATCCSRSTPAATRPNVLAAVDAAHAKDMTVIALTGRGGGTLREPAGRNRRAHLRAARPRGARPGGARCWCCTACATRSTCNCWANRTTHEHRLRISRRRAPSRLLAAAGRWPAPRSAAARRCWSAAPRSAAR